MKTLTKGEREGSSADAIVAVRTSFAGIAIVRGTLEARRE
jgi:hypothetical protein